MKLKLINSFILGLIFLTSQNCNAGVFTDDLSRCLVQSTSQSDRVSLVKWMFASASLHPAVKSIALVTPKQLDESNKETADLFIKLMTVSCKEKAKNAVKHEGQLAIQAGFQVLGQVAGRELFSSPEVSAGMAGLQKFMDTDKINKELGITQ